MRAMRNAAWGAATLALTLVATAAPAHADADRTERCISSSDAGQVQRDEHKLIEARASFLACGADECPFELRKQCQRWLDEVSARVPSVAISARDEAGRDVVDVRVFVDGKLLLSKLDGVAVPVNPGEHVFRYEPRGSAPSEERVLVREGESSRLVTVRVEGATSKPKPKPLEPLRTDSSRSSPDERPRSSSVPLGSVILAGVGVLGVGAFALFASTAKSQLDTLRSGCGSTRSCDSAEVDGVRRDLTIGNVALGVGALALAGAVFLYVWRSR
jgi:hypothetical protein